MKESAFQKQDFNRTLVPLVDYCQKVPDTDVKEARKPRASSKEEVTMTH
jgi:hypothetical protein